MDVNIRPEELLMIIGRQQVVIMKLEQQLQELLLEKNRGIMGEPANGTETGSRDRA